MSITGIAVPVGKRVIALWSSNIQDHNLRFLESLDPEFFATICDLLAKVDSGREEQHCTGQIRMMRDQAAEMLFALILATIQAPCGVALWMLSYRNDELDDMLRAVGSEVLVRTDKGRRTVSWMNAVEATTNGLQVPDEVLGRYRQQQAMFWERLAREFVDPLVRHEYSSFKHGLRIRPGGLGITIQQNATEAESNSDAKSVTLEAEFGGRFFVAERIGSQRHHFRIIEHMRSWNPAALCLQVKLIVQSARNIINYLRIRSGEKRHVDWAYPIDAQVFEDCWKPAAGIHAFKWGDSIRESDIPCLTKAELIDRCERPRLVDP